MSLTHLPEHAANALLALDLAERESRQLEYTLQTLFGQPIDQDWVNRLPDHPERAEKIDAFVSRFGRLQDHIGEKLIPRFSVLMGERTKSLLDTLAHAERMGWVENAEAFIGSRKLKNQLIHEYMTDPSMFLEALLTAKEASRLLLDVVVRMRRRAEALNLRNGTPAAESPAPRTGPYRS